VVVSQSWNEIHKVNEQVRLGLKAQKLIGADETMVTALERQDLTDAQKRDKRFYQPDSVLVFNRPTAGFKSGSAGKLRGITDRHLLIEADNRIGPVPFKDLITISFLNRTVRIKGKNLRNLGVALQARNVESIKPMAERYSSLAAGEDGWVKTIEIEDEKARG
jgi:hypothetical protein